MTEQWRGGAGAERSPAWTPPDRQRRVKSVDRLVVLLNAFSERRPALTLAEAAELLGVHKSSASRLLRQLSDLGILTRLADGQGYGVGVRLFEIGSLYAATNDLVRMSHSFLQRLVEATGHTAQLCVQDDFESVVVASEESRQLIRAAANLGGRLPATTTASGRVFLAHRTDSEVRDQWAATRQRGHRQPTLRQLLEVIEGIRGDGVCMVIGEYRPELVSLAAPVYRAGQGLAGALCLVAPNTEQARERLPAYRSAVVELAWELSGSLGHPS